MSITNHLYSDYRAAARKALLNHPEKQSRIYPLDEVAEAISECMEKGYPEAVVTVWGRDFALSFFAALDAEGPAVDRLHQAIASGVSVWDDLGNEPMLSSDDEPLDGERFAALAHEAYEASRKGVLSVEELQLRELFATTYRRHGDKLPVGIFGEDYELFGAEGRVVNLDMQAAALYGGAAGVVVHQLGRAFASLVADELPALGMFSLYALLIYAVKTCKTPFDDLGHLDYRSTELRLYA